MATDRTIRKQQEAGAFNSPASSTANAIATIAAIHTRAYTWTKAGTENSSNNVGEVSMFTVNRAGTIKSFKLTVNASIAANATNGMVMTVNKYTGAGAAVPVASWNTDTNTAAQGAITTLQNASFLVVTSSDANVAAGDVLTFKCVKFGTGSLLGQGGATLDVEET